LRIANMVSAIDAHACGEPGRVIVGGVLDVPGKTMFEKAQYLQCHADHLRKRMLREPRGYPALCCNLILPPTQPNCDAGFVIMEQVEYPPMSGSNTICVVTVLIETGMVKVEEPMTTLLLDTPAGVIRVRAAVSYGKVTAVTFENVPAFAVHLDVPIEVPSLGTVRVDVAYGGMFYVLAEAASFGLELAPDHGRDLVRVGEMVKAAAREQLPVQHPENQAIQGISIAELTGPSNRPGVHGKNTVIVSSGSLDWLRPESWTGVLDRSPCGTGTCARMAVLHAKGELLLHQEFVHEGILGTTFTGKLIDTRQIGRFHAVIPTITGRAWITGIAQYTTDSEDPFPEGFTVGDLWPQ
jgi:proline racemase